MTDIPAIDKLKRDLAWRGPGGHVQGNVVLPREMAEQLVKHIEHLEQMARIAFGGTHKP